jgi:hypothetical protein
MAVDADKFFPMYPETGDSPRSVEGVSRDPVRAACSAQAREKVRLEGGRPSSSSRASSRPTASRSGPFEFVVSGIYDADLAKYPGTDVSSMYFHYEYLKEGVGP